MKLTQVARWTAFVAVLGMVCDCASNNSNRGGSGSSKLELDGKTYGEKYTCNEQFGGVPPTTCPDLNEVDEIVFSSTGPSTYVVHDVPDTGFIMNGTLTDTSFVWSATSPLGYAESGTWTFSDSGDTFTGTSHYVANDVTYAGDCNTNGSLGAGTTPPDPPSPSGCP